MLQLSTLLQPEQIQVKIYCTSKKRLFEMLGKIFASQLQSLPSEEKEQIINIEQSCMDALFNREKIGNSSLGCGMAFPKGRIPFGDKPIAAFIQLTENLDYESCDNKPVDLVFALLIPEKLCENISLELPNLTKRLQDKNFCKALRQAENETNLWELLLENDKATLQIEENCKEN